MDRRIRVRVHLALIFIQITFGAFHVFGKYVLGFLEPLAMASIRAAAAIPLLLLLAARAERRIPSRRDMLVLAGLGFLGVFANQILYILGLKLTTATNAGVLMPTIPVFVAALGALMGLERLDGRKVLGVGLAVAGALAMADLPALGRGGGAAALGNALLAGNCMAYAAYLVLQRPLLDRMRPVTVVAWAFLFGGSGVFLAGLPALARAPFGTLPAGVWWALAFIVLIPTVANYALNSWAIRHSSPTLVATYTTLQPVSAALLAMLWLGDRPGWWVVVGFVLILAGLWAVAGGKGREAVKGK
jgi:drug/metabolite transporter (DMT)-like permease